MAQRICPSCNATYPDTQTNCTSCSETPVGFVTGTQFSGALALGEVKNRVFNPTTPLGDDQFIIRRILGFGNMALAYLATNKFGNQVVIKELRPSNKPKVQEYLLGSFLREAAVQYKVGRFLSTHVPLFPPLPKGYGCFEVTFGSGSLAITRHYAVMDYMEGADWDAIQGDPPMGALPLLDVLQMAMEICIILQKYLHGYNEKGKKNSIIHRDIKPANIIRLKATATSCMLDFGIAREGEVSTATMARGGTRGGTPAFAPPEFDRRGVKKLEPSFDTYCLCTTIWALLANVKEFPEMRADQLTGIRDHIQDTELQQILTKGTNEAPAGRYQTAEELRQALEKVYTALRPLPSHLVVASVSAASSSGGTTGVNQPAASDVVIQWDATKTRLSGTPTPTRFSKVLSGRVTKGNQPLPAVNVVVARIVDDPGGQQSVNVGTITTDVDGYFSLDQADTTVDISAQTRRISIRVEDAGGIRLTTNEQQIKRPSNNLGKLKNWFGKLRQQNLNTAQAGATQQANWITRNSWFGWSLFVILLLLTVYGAITEKHFMWTLCSYLWIPALLLAKLNDWKLTWKQALLPKISFAYISSWLIFFVRSFQQ